jgi:hypothetical protein
MNKFLVYAAIGGALAYLGHRKSMADMDAHISFLRRNRV